MYKTAVRLIIIGNVLHLKLKVTTRALIIEKINKKLLDSFFRQKNIFFYDCIKSIYTAHYK